MVEAGTSTTGTLAPSGKAGSHGPPVYLWAYVRWARRLISPYPICARYRPPPVGSMGPLESISFFYGKTL